jgi:hypothetical protein
VHLIGDSEGNAFALVYDLIANDRHYVESFFYEPQRFAGRGFFVVIDVEADLARCSVLSARSRLLVSLLISAFAAIASARALSVRTGPI